MSYPNWSSPVGSEFKAIKLSMWKKNSLHFAWKLCPVYFYVVFVCPGHFSEGGPCVSVHFTGLSWLVLLMKDVVAVADIHASVLLAFQHMECLLLIYFCICYCC